MCEAPETTTQALVSHIAMRNSQVRTEQDATQYLASLATVSIASRAKLLNYTTMVQHFLGTLQLAAHGCLHAGLLSANAQPQ